MSTETQTIPELKTLDRVYSIPLVHDGLTAIHHTLTTYTPTVYSYGQAVGSSAYNLSAPLQVRLAPLLLSADGYAIKGLDVVQEKYPTPFTIKTEDIVEGINARKENAYNSIATPVYGYATKVDSSLTPILDRIESVIGKRSSHHEAEESASSSSSEATIAPVDSTQARRAYRLSIDLKDQIYALSGDQLKQLQNNSAFLKEQVHVASQNVQKELEKFQATTKTLPSALQASLKPVQEGIQGTLAELSAIAKSDLPVGERVSKVAITVQEKIQPLLEQASSVLHKYLSEGRSYLSGTKADVQQKATEVQDEAHDKASEATGTSTN